MLVNRELTSKLPIKNSESCSAISSAKANYSCTAYSLLIEDFKIGTGSFPSLCAMNTPAYNLAKFLVPILKSLTSNEYTVRDSFAFVEVVGDHDSEFFMGSLDVDSLFSNIPLKETNDICTITLFENTERVVLLKIEFKELLSLAAIESYFIFNGKLYKQVNGVAMGSPLGATSANAFFVDFEKKNGYKIDHLTLSLITTNVMMMISLFPSLNRTFRILPEFSKWPLLLRCHLQLKMKSKIERPFLMCRLFVRIKHLPFLSTANLPLVEAIHIFIGFYHLPIRYCLHTHL